MKTSDFEYNLPERLIAQTPVEPRDASRLMVVHRDRDEIEHRVFRDVIDYLRPGDLLVLNQTRVIRARLFGRKAITGGKVELLLLHRRDPHTWETLVGGKGLRAGVVVEQAAAGKRQVTGRRRGWRATIVGETEAGGRVVRFEEPVDAWLEEVGVMPLPPYIHEPLADDERYQTVYGRIEGSVAASTAGLHFTPELLVQVRRMGVELAFVTLHISLDTFRPVKEETVEEHPMHSEWFEVTAPVAEQVNCARLEGRRVIAVGTTVVRALETAARGSAQVGCDAKEGIACGWRTVSAYTGATDLFIYPGYRFRVVEAMITNFHLPRSTLLMLVSAFAGREMILRAYDEAVEQEYRFFSFGDAMLLL
ncbi:MAG: tRNA preQ1(34) S-adenosylmethionine ribosyltransferase-isomerase QueA [Anaerolineae bacterium]|nr:tRNA preQ1(34) S-adenosylmethionine ribosyltransferase-isomerase QueA [Anaerolineae bacterium]